MGDYETVMAIAGFMIFSFLVLVPGGGADVLFNIPEDTEPPVLIPEQPDIASQNVDLQEDVYLSENITFKDTTELADPDYDTGTVAVLENGSDEGRLAYNTPGIVTATILSGKQCGGFIGTSRLSAKDTLNDSIFSLDLCAETKIKVLDNDNANFIDFKFQPPSDGAGEPQLYSLEWSAQEENNGLFGFTVLEQVADVLSYPVRLWDYFEHFPWYIKTFYGALLAYMIADLAQIG